MAEEITQRAQAAAKVASANITIICGSCAAGDHQCGGDCQCPRCTGVINGIEAQVARPRLARRAEADHDPALVRALLEDRGLPVTAPTLDVAELRRLVDGQDGSSGMRYSLVSWLNGHAPAILAALTELEELRTAIQTALDKLVPEDYIICRGCGRMGFHEPACLVPGLQAALVAAPAPERGEAVTRHIPDLLLGDHLDALNRAIERQDAVHPDGYPATRDGIFLGITTAVHELEREAIDAWRAGRCKCPTPRCDHHDWQPVADELLDAAAVIMRCWRSIASREAAGRAAAPAEEGREGEPEDFEFRSRQVTASVEYRGQGKPRPKPAEEGDGGR